MCGRYGLYDAEDFNQRFEVDPDTPPIKPNYNAAPGQFLPVVINESGERQEAIWLDQSLDDRELLAEMLVPYEDGKIEMFEVSTDVNVVKNNDNHLVLPLNSK